MIPFMSSPSDETEYAVLMEVSDWTTIDAVMDNEIHSLRSEGWDVPEGQEDRRDDERDPYWAGLTDLGESIRQAGWGQLPDWPEEYEVLQRWPAPGQTQAMRLTARQWGLVLSALEHWAGIEDEEESASRLQTIATTVRSRLAEQGLAAVPQPVER